jgi:hypothetical protein
VVHGDRSHGHLARGFGQARLGERLAHEPRVALACPAHFGSSGMGRGCCIAASAAFWNCWTCCCGVAGVPGTTVPSAVVRGATCGAQRRQ